MHTCPDALSRHPPPRDYLTLARTGEWEQQRLTIRGLERAIRKGDFDNEEPGPQPSWEEACAETDILIPDRDPDGAGALSAAGAGKVSVSTNAAAPHEEPQRESRHVTRRRTRSMVQRAAPPLP